MRGIEVIFAYELINIYKKREKDLQLKRENWEEREMKRIKKKNCQGKIYTLICIRVIIS
jgi:hypothetical protein